MNNKREVMRKKYNNTFARYLLENGEMQKETAYAEIMGEKVIIEKRIVLTIEVKSFEDASNELMVLWLTRQRILINGASFFVESIEDKPNDLEVYTLVSRY